MAQPSFSDRVKSLGLPLDQIIVIASGALDAHGIRQADDIDLAVSAGLFESFEGSEDWRPHRSGWGELYYRQGDCEAWAGWTEPGSDKPLYDDLLPYTQLIDGVRYMTLEYVRNWKEKKGRDKDLRDIKLIDEYNKPHDRD